MQLLYPFQWRDAQLSNPSACILLRLGGRVSQSCDLHFPGFIDTDFVLLLAFSSFFIVTRILSKLNNPLSSKGINSTHLLT